MDLHPTRKGEAHRGTEPQHRQNLSAVPQELSRRAHLRTNAFDASGGGGRGVSRSHLVGQMDGGSPGGAVLVPPAARGSASTLQWGLFIHLPKHEGPKCGDLLFDRGAGPCGEKCARNIPVNISNKKIRTDGINEDEQEACAYNQTARHLFSRWVLYDYQPAV